MLHLLLAFFAGLFVKATDWMDDEEKGTGKLKYMLAFAYGTTIGYLLSQAGFSMLFLAALFAQVFARKIDTHTHVLGFVVAIAVMLVLGVPQFESVPFLVLLVAAFADESEGSGRYTYIQKYRPFLKLAAFAFVFFGRADFFLAIIAFDFGYVLYEWAKGNIHYKSQST